MVEQLKKEIEGLENLYLRNENDLRVLQKKSEDIRLEISFRKGKIEGLTNKEEN